MYKAIIFDVSDTLVDYTPNHAAIYGDKVRALGFDVPDETAMLMSRAVKWAGGQQILAEQNGAPYAQPDEFDRIQNRAALACVDFDPEKEDEYLRQMALLPKAEQEMRVMPGVFETLDALRGKYRLAIVSNHHAWLPDKLKELRLYDYFEAVVISEAVGVEKPDPRIIEIALEQMGLAARDCLYVGDHPLDVLCAKRAGAHCAWINYEWERIPDIGSYKEDYLIASITELPALL
jgi:HAD superfamily hydrolase (TIGR01549 family)